ncbi:zinc finger BED domain-containing protein RICESLEEPER 3-like [Carya illinoinensis]|uniref:zinc finger BED domain-containing protein RICESLEEPER 3-like n=1 Tax=Carya illinoinensis TaxID=32201 RepID=UPI001C718A18|nr:zinc finger BED domain-containing protein RICESLEEPER 3-like [Carya illinoinensis]
MNEYGEVNRAPVGTEEDRGGAYMEEDDTVTGADVVVDGSTDNVGGLIGKIDDHDENAKDLLAEATTRWNSTYLMLEAVEKFEKAFRRMESEDYNFLPYFDNWHMGPPKTTEWETVFLETYDLQTELIMLSESTNTCLRSMVINMRTKYDKYCGSLDMMNLFMLIAVVLDPRSKLEFLTFHLKKIHDEFRAEEMVSNVRQILADLYAEYNVTFGSTMSTPVSQPPPTSTFMNEGNGKRETKWF